MTSRTRSILASLLALALALGSGCSKSSDAGQGEQRELPPLGFSDATPDLMLTWIDERGDTHVETSTKSVPKAHARFVRVVIADRDERDPIYVADVSEPDPAGSYVAHGVPRSRWEEEIARRRKEGGALAEQIPPPPPRRAPPREPRSDPAPLPAPPPNHDREPAAPPLDPSMANVKVVVYGASWCGSCHKALDHLKRKGVKADFRDIEKDGTAQVEMKTKLDRASGRHGAIPVIDVAGQILVGYSPRDLDRALEKARGGTML